MPNAYIKTIKEKSTGDIIYPKTTASAVYLTDDSTLDTKLNNMLVAENTGQIETESVDQQATVYYRNIAIIESSNVASKNYVEGQYLIYQNQLYIVTAAIASGDTLTVGTNIASTSVGDEITELENKLAYSTLSITRIENSYFTATNIDRLKAYKKYGMLYLLGNLGPGIAIPSGGDFFNIAQIEGWHAIEAVTFTMATQNNTAIGTIWITVNGLVQFINASGTTIPASNSWMRFSISVPSID